MPQIKKLIRNVSISFKHYIQKKDTVNQSQNSYAQYSIKKIEDCDKKIQSCNKKIAQLENKSSFIKKLFPAKTAENLANIKDELSYLKNEKKTLSTQLFQSTLFKSIHKNEQLHYTFSNKKQTLAELIKDMEQNPKKFCAIQESISEHGSHLLPKSKSTILDLGH